MKILLIQPPMILNKNERPQLSPPLGLAYIASTLREYNHDVTILDSIILGKYKFIDNEKLYIGLSWEEIRKKIFQDNFDIVGISCMFSSQAKQSHYLAKLVKECDKNIIVIIGGAHPSALPIETLKDENIDFCVIGEGEEVMLKLTKYLSKSYKLEIIDGIGYKKDKHIVINQKISYIKNLDELPFPAWDLLDMKKYLKLKIGHSPLIKDTPFFSVVTSRGCPMNCIFCSIHCIWGYKWRARTPKNVVDEIEILKEKYGIKEIHFEDDNLTLNKKRMKEICDEIIKRKIDISWSTPNGVKINTLDYELLKKMKKSGCFSLSFGIESGSEYIRDNIIKKPIIIPHAKKVIKWCRDLGIWTNGYFILGIPGENKKNFLETIDCAKELNLDSASFFIATPYPGTRLLKTYKEGGYIKYDLDYSKMRVTDAVIKTESFNPEDFKKWRIIAYKEFTKYFIKREFLYLNIIRRILKIRSLSDIDFFGKLMMRFFRGFS